MLRALRNLIAPPPQATYHRRWRRILMSEPARLTLAHGFPRAAMLEEICAGGARVTTSERLAPGLVVGIEFKTNAGDHHSLSAVVVHTLKDERGFNWRSGLCFVNAEPRETQRLADFVEEERKRRTVGFAMPRV